MQIYDLRLLFSSISLFSFSGLILTYTGSILKYLSWDMSFFCQIVLYLYFICLISLAKSQNDFSFFHYASNLAFDHKIWWLDIKSDDRTSLKNWRLAGDFPWCSIILKVHVQINSLTCTNSLGKRENIL